MSEIEVRRSVNCRHQVVAGAIEWFFQSRKRPGSTASAVPLRAVLNQSGIGGSCIISYDVTLGPLRERNTAASRWPLEWRSVGGDRKPGFGGELWVRSDPDNGGCQVIVRGASTMERVSPPGSEPSTDLFAHIVAHRLLSEITALLDRRVDHPQTLKESLCR